MLYGGVICHIVLMVGSNQITSQEHSAGRCAGGGALTTWRLLAASTEGYFSFLLLSFLGFASI